MWGEWIVARAFSADGRSSRGGEGDGEVIVRVGSRGARGLGVATFANDLGLDVLVTMGGVCGVRGVGG